MAHYSEPPPWAARRLGRAVLGAAGLLLLLAAAAAPAALAQEAAAPDLPAEVEEAGLRLDKQLMCPICPGETLNQSQTALAKQMRAAVRQRLLAGESEQEVKDYFVSVYGESVLAEPPRRGFGLTAWLVPAAVAVAGLGTLVFVLRSMRRSNARQAAAPATPPDPALADYLRAVDAELGIGGGGGGAREGGKADDG
ncbi:MAG: cytochrome c-type biogenesis protein CcmH [Dehalococcoidia bacterium]|nr:cytochrome c-type biogenesis protein CcmH [Dehalococcoidia bacterium]